MSVDQQKLDELVKVNDELTLKQQARQLEVDKLLYQTQQKLQDLEDK